MMWNKKISITDIEFLEEYLFDETVDRYMPMSEICEEYKKRARIMPYSDVLNYMKKYSDGQLTIGHHTVTKKREFYIFLAHHYDQPYEVCKLRVDDVRRYEAHKIKEQVKTLALQRK